MNRAHYAQMAICARSLTARSAAHISRWCSPGASWWCYCTMCMRKSGSKRPRRCDVRCCARRLNRGTGKAPGARMRFLTCFWICHSQQQNLPKITGLFCHSFSHLCCHRCCHRVCKRIARLGIAGLVGPRLRPGPGRGQVGGVVELGVPQGLLARRGVEINRVRL